MDGRVRRRLGFPRPQWVVALALGATLVSSVVVVVSQDGEPEKASLQLVEEPTPEPGPSSSPEPIPSPTPVSPSPSPSPPPPSPSPTPSRSPRDVPDLGTGRCRPRPPNTLGHGSEPLYYWREGQYAIARVADLRDDGAHEQADRDQRYPAPRRASYRVVEHWRGDLGSRGVMDAFTMEDALGEAPYSDTFLVIGAYDAASDRWYVQHVGAVHDDGSVAFTGDCVKYFTQTVRDFAADRARQGDRRTAVELLEAVGREPDGPTARQLQEFAYPPPPPPPSWYELPPHKRGLCECDTPPPPEEVRRTLNGQWVDLVIPDSWRSFDLIMATYVPTLGWNAGTYMSAGQSGRDLGILSFYRPDLTLELHALTTSGGTSEPSLGRLHVITPDVHNGEEVRLAADPAITTQEELLRRARAGEVIFRQVPGNGLG